MSNITVTLQIDINILNQLDSIVDYERKKILNSKLSKRKKRELLRKHQLDATVEIAK